MKKHIFRGALVIAFVMALLQGGFASAADEPVANMIINPTLVYWEPLVSFDQLVLTVSGSGGANFKQVFNAGSTPVFDLYDEYGELFPDGSCTYELVVVPYVDPGTRELMNQTRESGTDVVTSSSSVPTGLSQFGFFTIKDGLVVLNTVSENAPEAPSGDGIDQMQVEQIDAPQDVVHIDDLIVVGSACIGQDCSNGENFGFDTIRLKENNLRIRFFDTSNSGSFPSVDWQLTANDSANGGANKFSIDDLDSGRTPFTVLAGAPTNSLYIDGDGDVGFGTSTPGTDLHVVSGNTPTLRLDQNSSSGFTAQVWDVAGNEAGFFIRDNTHGGNLAFRIQPSAPANSIYIKSDGKVGIGTNSPTGGLHIKQNTVQTVPLVIYEASQTTELNRYPFMEYKNKGHFVTYLEDSGSDGSSWSYGIWDKYFIIDTPQQGAGWEFKINQSGDLTILGTLTASAVSTPDYVFEQDYQLMPLADLHEYVKTNRHLPNIPNADDIKANGVNMTNMQMKLLEKIEELTLYTIAQQETINELKDRLEKLDR